MSDINKSVCPECGSGTMEHRTESESWDYCVGWVGASPATVRAYADSVPVSQCNSCKAVVSGPEAAKARESAIIDALCSEIVRLRLAERKHS